jgi:hypothetical protein
MARDMLTAELIERYKLSKSTIHRVLEYNAPKRARPSRTSRLQLLINTRINEIIEYYTKS